MRYHEIMEKSEPNNPQLWGRAKAEASKRYNKHSAYKMGWAAKWYKEKGGTWKTVTETIEDMINEISRPSYRNEAVELLISKGYEQLGSGTFANVFLRKSRPNEVIKLFGTNDGAYETYIDFIMKHQDNPHFPKVIGKPMLITPDYYAVKLERLEPYKIRRDGHEMVDGVLFYLNNHKNESFDTYLEAFPKFKEALDLVKKHNDEVSYGYDIHSGNLMWRGKTLVLTDPLYDPDAMEGYDRSGLSEDMINEISRPDTQEDADKILNKAGYKRLGHGSFGAVYEKGDKIIKTFTSQDAAYLLYIKEVLKHKNNPHFPKIYGKPIRITSEYYGIKIEKLKPGTDIRYDYIREYIINVNYVNQKQMSELRFYDYVKQFGKPFEEACKVIANLLNNNPSMKIDLYHGNENIMMRGNTIVFVDPVYDDKDIVYSSLPDFESWKKPEAVGESLSKWFDENWVDISRKEGGKHPECGASAGKGRRKKSSKAAYPKCVKKSKADTMTKKEKESASRRKRDVERNSTGKKVNMVKTDT